MSLCEGSGGGGMASPTVDGEAALLPPFPMTGSWEWVERGCSLNFLTDGCHQIVYGLGKGVLMVL